jgi:hypothetical protein
MDVHRIFQACSRVQMAGNRHSLLLLQIFLGRALLGLNGGFERWRLFAEMAWRLDRRLSMPCIGSSECDECVRSRGCNRSSSRAARCIPFGARPMCNQSLYREMKCRHRLPEMLQVNNAGPKAVPSFGHDGWSNFQPRFSMPRQGPGDLFYPDGASHVFEECWQFFSDLSQMPSFCSKSEICQSAMLSFSQGLSRYPCDAWIPYPVAEAPEKLAKIAQNAAISRVRPISHGPNQWEMYRSSTYTGCQSSLGLSVLNLGAGTGSMGTCAGCSSPP